MDAVPRETPPAGLVAELFGAADMSIRRYVDMLTSTGVTRGLIGPKESGRIWSRHILNCAVVARGIPPGATVADLGSGAGLPGLVWAIARPDLELTVVDSQLRRTTFLKEVVSALGLANVEILRARAEELVGHRTFDVVTARALAPLARLAPLALPLCAPGGAVLAFKGASASAELADAETALRRLSAAARIESHGTGLVDPPVLVVRIESSNAQS
ncbi:MAG TPA: 16S rRNA (guanine(527)-N(7))-methyltransferase RsmG [Nocardioidaceae bacterium]|nr:16S rRNA (guanine(527)-N(7))-methyltransferase RsmG [Nocardioidaceae bacterium]